MASGAPKQQLKLVLISPNFSLGFLFKPTVCDNVSTSHLSVIMFFACGWLRTLLAIINNVSSRTTPKPNVRENMDIMDERIVSMP